MNWTAECKGCGWQASSRNRQIIREQILAHKRATGHKVHLTGSLTVKEVERCKYSGRTYLAAVGQVL